MRSRLAARSSAKPGSWMGTRPASSSARRSGTTSRTTTSWPRSAKHAAVTRPTQPAPRTPIGSLPLMCESLLSARRAQALRDREHRLVREPVEQRVHHPVGGAVLLERDHVEALPVEEELVLAAPDLL